MDDILNVVFYYQKFTENGKLQIIIDDVIDEYTSDEEIRKNVKSFEPEAKKDS